MKIHFHLEECVVAQDLKSQRIYYAAIVGTVLDLPNES